MRLRILSISCVFPSPVDPEAGLFVRHRLQRVAQHADVTVIAPVPALDYGNPRRRLLASWAVPHERRDGNLKIFHPRWLYPPFGSSVNAFCLAGRLLPLARALKKTFPFSLLDVHFGHPEGIAGVILARYLGCPFLVTLRGNETKHAQNRMIRALMSWSLTHASRVITLSERLRQFAIALGANPSDVKTIPNGVDTDVFRPLERAVCRSVHRLDPDVPIVLSAGYLIERKGHHHIVRTMMELSGRAAGAHLIIAGGAGREGKFEEELRRIIADQRMESRVHLLGSVTQRQLAELMSAADVLCLASSREGWPNVVQEALACGTPVVATDVGAVPDMIPSEDYGYVVPAGDQSRLREALQSAMSRSWDRERISELGQSRSWDLVAKQVLEEMCRVARGE
jgi:glycosyltransferase involved in cell wall biosynthesis